MFSLYCLNQYRNLTKLRLSCHCNHLDSHYDEYANLFFVKREIIKNQLSTIGIFTSSLFYIFWPIVFGSLIAFAVVVFLIALLLL